MPSTHRVRPAPCSHCGDTVLVVEQHLGRLFGVRAGRKVTQRLEHADPGPDDEVFDGVDDACRRSRVAP